MQNEVEEENQGLEVV